MIEPLRIMYVADTRLPTEKAHGLALMKLAEAFSDRGASVEVVVPKLWTRSTKNPYQYYGVKENFSVVHLWSADLLPLRIARPVLYLIQAVSFSLHALLYVRGRLKGKKEKVVVFSHDYIPLYFLSFLSIPFYYDVHHFPGKNFMYRRVMRLACGFSVQTKWKIEELNKRFDVPLQKITYWPNGTDVEEFAIDSSQDDARRELSLQIEGKIAMYTGQFFGWKGVETFVASAAYLPKDMTLICVGGTPEDTEQLKREVEEASDPRVVFIPFQRRHTMPTWLRAADVLVLPNTGKQKVSLYYTSPMKLFEYMASGRPIVSSRVPSVEEIVSEREVYFAKPDDPASFAEAISLALRDGEGGNRALRAREEAAKYTWDRRAEVLLPHMIACHTQTLV